MQTDAPALSARLSVRCVVTRGAGIPRALARALARRLWRAGRRLGVPPVALARLTIYVVDDAEIAALNREHMGKRGPTDVLSFPAGGPPELGLGEIVLCWPAVTRQARAGGPEALLDEASVLAVHGLAHLLGHDHRDAREGRRMHDAELRGLAAIGVADVARPYGRRARRSGR
ncbi:MAG: rRNA maturation RNase YbeY [Myxococcales bacterium]|nr:rRNA maturation RNase YbeY [Myxococcales bacterium]